MDADGALLAGSRELAAGARLVRELIVGGQVVARLLLALPPLPAGADDVGFLVRQYRGIAGVGVAVLLLASLFAVLIARRWARPLQTMREASARIASGAFDVRVPVSGGDELADLGHDMNSMAASLARLELARRRWIAESAHELRTPLTVLRGEIEAMLDGVRPIDAAGIRSFQAEVGQLARLVDELHELAVTDMAERPSRLDVFDAHALARRTVDAFGSSARSRGVVLTCLAPAAQLQVHWDAGRIEQVLRNLLENALRYTDPPGRIDLRVESDGDRVRLIVDDSPPGVDPKLREQMFEPLWRADAARSRHGAGSGLGLAIVAGIVRQHRGTIAASDSPLGGLRITVTLPRDAGADREPRSPEVSDAGSPAPGLRRRG
ncbi:MAG: ATP-binding protein [Burkholderiaceae bacterium]